MPRLTNPDEGSMAAALPEASVTLWGVRGSTPLSGQQYLAFGGDTICLEVSVGGRRIIVDAGTGIEGLGRKLVHLGVLEIEIVLTHYHLDHLLGLMNFAPLFAKGGVVTLHAPILGGRHPHRILRRLFSAPYFPIGPEEVCKGFSIRAFRPGAQIQMGDVTLSTCRLRHPGGACGYRINHGGRSIAVILDHEHGAPAYDRAITAFCRGADLILYDAHWDESVDYEPHRGWGHSTWQAGVRLLRAAGAKRLACVHHAPAAFDDVLIAREQQMTALHPEAQFGRRGATFHLTAPSCDQEAVRS